VLNCVSTIRIRPNSKICYSVQPYN